MLLTCTCLSISHLSLHLSCTNSINVSMIIFLSTYFVILQHTESSIYCHYWSIFLWYWIDLLRGAMWKFIKHKIMLFQPKSLKSYKLPRSKFLSVLICERSILILLADPTFYWSRWQRQSWNHLNSIKSQNFLESDFIFLLDCLPKLLLWCTVGWHWNSLWCE